VREVEDHLIVGVRVNRGHGSADDLELVVDDLGDGRQTVGGAGCVRNDVMLGAIVFFMVHAEHERDVFVLGGGGNNHFLYRAAHVLFRVIGVGEVAGGFDHHLGANGIPGQSAGIPLFENFDGFIVDGDAVCACADLVGQIAEDGIVFQEMCESLGIGEIVHRHEFQVGIVERGP